MIRKCVWNKRFIMSHVDKADCKQVIKDPDEFWNPLNITKKHPFSSIKYFKFVFKPKALDDSMWTLQQTKHCRCEYFLLMIYVYHYATIITQFKSFGRNSFFMLTICEKVCKYSVSRSLFYANFFFFFMIIYGNLILWRH